MAKKIQITVQLDKDTEVSVLRSKLEEWFTEQLKEGDKALITIKEDLGEKK